MADKRWNIHVDASSATTAAAKLRGVDGALSGIAKSAISAAAGYMGAAGLVAATMHAIKASGEAEAGLARLRTAYGSGTSGLQAYAAARAKATAFDDDATISAMALIATHIKSEKEIKRLVVSAQDLATKLGIDLNSATMMIMKATGGSTGALGRYGIEIDKTIPLIDAITKAIDSYAKGQAEAFAATDAGKIVQQRNKWEEIAETWGDVVAPTALFLGDMLLEVGDAIMMPIDKFNMMRDTAKDFSAESSRTSGALLGISFAAKDAAESVGVLAEKLPTLPPMEVVGDRGKFLQEQSAAEQRAADGAYNRDTLLDALREKVHQNRLARFNETSAALQKESDEAQAPHDAEAKRQQEVWDANLAARELRASDAEWIAELMKKEADLAKLKKDTVKAGVGAALGSMAQLNAAAKGNATMSKRLAQAEAVWNTANAATAALKNPPGPPWTIPMFIATLAMGAVQVATIQAQQFASGGWVDGHGGSRSDSVPARLSSGERVLSAREIALMGGRGAVDAIARGGGGGNVINLTVNGPIDQQWWSDVAIPQLTRAWRLSA